MAFWRLLSAREVFHRLSFCRRFLSDIVETSNSGPTHVNSAALEKGLTKYYRNRNPRSFELLGIAEKPRGFATKRYRVDYYHR